MRTISILSLALLLVAGTAMARIVTGGGYVGIDSTETSDPWCPDYNWIDASSGDDFFSSYADDGNATQPTPFDVMFFDEDYYEDDYMHACTNGWFSFTSSSTIYSNTSIPNGGEPYTSICVYWDDLVYRDITPHSHIYSYVEGTSPDRIWVLSYVDIYAIATTTDPGSFQVQIFEEPSESPYNNTIEFHYYDVSLGGTGHDHGESATVGMQNENSSDGIEYSYNEDILDETMAIRFYDEDRPTLSVQPASLGNIKATIH